LRDVPPHASPSAQISGRAIHDIYEMASEIKAVVLQTTQGGELPSRATNFAEECGSGTPAFDAGSLGALPGSAAISLQQRTNHRTKNERFMSNKLKQSECSGAEPELAGDQHPHTGGLPFVRWPLVWRQVWRSKVKTRFARELGRVVNTADSRAG